MRLPTGARIACVLLWVDAAFVFLSGFFFLLFPASFSALMSPERLVAFGYLYVLLGLAMAAVAWGVGSVQPWARKGGIVVAVVLIVDQAVKMIQGVVSAFMLVWLLLAAVILYILLFDPLTVRAFAERG